MMSLVQQRGLFFASPDRPGTASRRTLLIVDDEKGPRESLYMVFHQEYQVLLAESGERALEIAKKHPIDAAVLDIRMAGMSGIELLEKLKSFDPTIEVIMLTGYETLETIRLALRFGARDYLSKPFDVHVIRASVREAMERKTFSEEIKDNHDKLQALQTEFKNHQEDMNVARDRGEIYADIIHDINNPLMVISGFIEMINFKLNTSHYLVGQDLEMVKDRLKGITRQVTHCIEISQRYLSFLGRTHEEAGKSSVAEILKKSLELLNMHPHRLEHGIEVLDQTENSFVRMNATDIVQVLVNLAGNAFQSTREKINVQIRCRVLTEPIDFLKLQISPTDRVINWEGLINTSPLVVFSVSDNGPGIPPEIMPRLFEPYFTTKPKGEGTGLGLSIVQRLIKQSHGAIHCHSEPGHGTSFSIFLPGQLSGA